MSPSRPRRQARPQSTGATPTRRRWRRQPEICYRQVQDLAVRRHLFVEFRFLVEANPRLAKADSTFFDWLVLNYSDAMAIGIRRQVDPHRDAVSLLRILEEIAARPQLVSRTAFVARYRGQRPRNTELGRLEQDALREIGHARFDEIVSKGRSSLSTADLRRDLRRLRVAEGKVRRFANRRVAHRDRRVVRSLPTFAELHTAVDGIAEIVIKYGELLGLDEPRKLVPVWQSDWKRVFRFAWYESDRDSGSRIARPPLERGAPES